MALSKREVGTTYEILNYTDSDYESVIEKALSLKGKERLHVRFPPEPGKLGADPAGVLRARLEADDRFKPPLHASVDAFHSSKSTWAPDKPGFLVIQRRTERAGDDD